MFLIYLKIHFMHKTLIDFYIKWQHSQNVGGALCSGAIWERFEVDLRSIWGRFEIDLRSNWGRFEAELRPNWGRIEVELRPPSEELTAKQRTASPITGSCISDSNAREKGIFRVKITEKRGENGPSREEWWRCRSCIWYIMHHA